MDSINERPAKFLLCETSWISYEPKIDVPMDNSRNVFTT